MRCSVTTCSIVVRARGIGDDIELWMIYPAHYDTYAKQQHRWARGDWQIASWLFPRDA